MSVGWSVEKSEAKKAYTLAVKAEKMAAMMELMKAEK